MNLTNDEMIDEWTNDPWYAPIKRCDELLEYIIPGYRIVQIKSRFGGLRYYFELPELVNEFQREIAFAIVRDAENKVDKIEAKARGEW